MGSSCSRGPHPSYFEGTRKRVAVGRLLLPRLHEQGLIDHVIDYAIEVGTQWCVDEGPHDEESIRFIRYGNRRIEARIIRHQHNPILMNDRITLRPKRHDGWQRLTKLYECVWSDYHDPLPDNLFLCSSVRNVIWDSTTIIVPPNPSNWLETLNKARM